MRAPSVVPTDVLREQGDSTHYAYDGQFIFASDKIYVKFRADATAEDRQAVVDAFDGAVIGGVLGQYYLRISDTAQDRHGTSVISALRQIRVMPGVKSTEAEVLTRPSAQYARPIDGTGFTSWQLQPQNATGANWGEEAVAAPLAWGCATGDTIVKVGVVDQIFDSVADLAPNMAAGVHYDNLDIPHGTEVASIMGAVGNNSLGMTGMMWHARIVAKGYFDSLPGIPDDQTTKYDLLNTALAGARVINLSAGICWGCHGHMPSDTSSADNVLVATDSSALAFVIDSLRVLGIRPLFVLSAGNNGLNARWNGFPAAARDSSLRHQILVVAASANSPSATGSLVSTSDTGSLVDLAAPGENVSALDDVGDLVDTLTGTSFAAPFVTGTAGLIMNFDVRDTIGDSVRAYIINGAIDGSRTAGGFPILNAYRALRRAARRHDAPMCGNRIWVANNELVVERNDTTGDTSVVSTSMPNYVYYLVPTPGGRSIYYYDTTGDVSAAQYQMDGSWSTVGGLLSYFADSIEYHPLGATWNLTQGFSHDADSVVFVCSWYPDDCGPWSPHVANVYVASAATFTPVLIDSLVSTDTIWTYGYAYAAQYGSIIYEIGTRDASGVSHDTIYSSATAATRHAHTVLRAVSGGIYETLQPSEDGTEITTTFMTDGGACQYEFWNATFSDSLRSPISIPCTYPMPSAIAQSRRLIARSHSARAIQISSAQVKAAHAAGTR